MSVLIRLAKTLNTLRLSEFEIQIFTIWLSNLVEISVDPVEMKFRNRRDFKAMDVRCERHNASTVDQSPSKFDDQIDGDMAMISDDK